MKRRPRALRRLHGCFLDEGERSNPAAAFFPMSKRAFLEPGYLRHCQLRSYHAGTALSSVGQQQR
jgi:hypothetical protein